MPLKKSYFDWRYRSTWSIIGPKWAVSSKWIPAKWVATKRTSLMIAHGFQCLRDHRRAEGDWCLVWRIIGSGGAATWFFFPPRLEEGGRRPRGSQGMNIAFLVFLIIFVCRLFRHSEWGGGRPLFGGKFLKNWKFINLSLVTWQMSRQRNCPVNEKWVTWFTCDLHTSNYRFESFGMKTSEASRPCTKRQVWNYPFPKSRFVCAVISPPPLKVWKQLNV